MRGYQPAARLEKAFPPVDEILENAGVETEPPDLIGDDDIHSFRQVSMK